MHTQRNNNQENADGQISITVEFSSYILRINHKGSLRLPKRMNLRWSHLDFCVSVFHNTIDLYFCVSVFHITIDLDFCDMCSRRVCEIQPFYFLKTPETCAWKGFSLIAYKKNHEDHKIIKIIIMNKKTKNSAITKGKNLHCTIVGFSSLECEHASMCKRF